jgi:hypothetical protein
MSSILSLLLLLVLLLLPSACGGVVYGPSRCAIRQDADLRSSQLRRQRRQRLRRWNEISRAAPDLDIVARIGVVAAVLTGVAAHRRTRQRHAVTWELLMHRYTPDEFVQRYRLNLKQFDALLERMLLARPQYAGTTERAFDPRLKLASSLLYLAGGRAMQCADLHGQRRATFYRHLDETLEVIIASERNRDNLPLYNDAAFADLQKRCAASGYYSEYVKGVYGFVDGIIIRTSRPYEGSPERFLLP